MTIKENLLAFILASLKKDLSRSDLYNLLTFISLHLDKNCFFHFLSTPKGFFSYEASSIINRFIKYNTISLNDTISIINRDLLLSLSQKVHMDLQCTILRLMSAYDNDKNDAIKTVEIKFSKNKKVHPDGILFTSGYEGRDIDTFIQLLLSLEISNLIDVRSNPISRKYGFSKNQLSHICKDVNINYIPMPCLGIPSNFRKKLKSKQDYRALFAEYEKQLHNNNIEEQNAIERFASNSSTVLMCFEADKELCHRTNLAKCVSLKSGMKVKDI